MDCPSFPSGSAALKAPANAYSPKNTATARRDSIAIRGIRRTAILVNTAIVNALKGLHVVAYCLKGRDRGVVGWLLLYRSISQLSAGRATDSHDAR